MSFFGNAWDNFRNTVESVAATPLTLADPSLANDVLSKGAAQNPITQATAALNFATRNFAMSKVPGYSSLSGLFGGAPADAYPAPQPQYYGGATGFVPPQVTYPAPAVMSASVDPAAAVYPSQAAGYQATSVAPSSGASLSTGTILLIAGAGLVLVLLVR
ncbi:MAG: hypothetical protein ACYCOR_19165 [Acidobacteriaceae bacterium]